MRQKVAAMLIAAALLPVQTPGRQEEMSLLGTNELVTYENTSVGGSLTPPEECRDCFYTITEEPVKGSLCLQENGCYVYTPRSGRSGRDSFSYSLSDGSGSPLRETRVRIRIMEQSEGVYYEDMRGRAEAFAAARLSEEGLFTGEYLVGRYCFNPEKPVTRGEFLSICLSLSGRPILSAVQCTGRQDDAAIPAWMKIDWTAKAAVADYCYATLFSGSYYHLWYLLSLIYAWPLYYLCRRFLSTKAALPVAALLWSTYHQVSHSFLISFRLCERIKSFHLSIRVSIGIHQHNTRSCLMHSSCFVSVGTLWASLWMMKRFLFLLLIVSAR